MNLLSRSLAVLAGCLALCAGALAAEDKVPEAFPLKAMEADAARYVRIIETFGTGDLEAALDLIEVELPRPFTKAETPFEEDTRARWRQGFRPLTDLNARFENVEFLGQKPLSSASRTLVFVAVGYGGPVEFRFRVFRYQGKWRIANLLYQGDWTTIEANPDFTRFEKPVTYDLDPLPSVETDE